MSIQIKFNTSTVNTTGCPNRKIEWIVVHYTAGLTSKSGSANNLAEWYKKGANPANPTSSDYIVDDGDIIRYNPDILNRYTWGAGGSKYSRMSTSQGGRYYGKCINKNCINIEVCSNKVNRKSLSADDRDWYFTEEELKLTAGLVKLLMNRYGVSGDHVIMHHHVTGKLCPAMWCHDEQELTGWRNFQKMFGYSENVKPFGDIIYCVQVGAFGSEKNALNFLEDVKGKYPAAFIKENGMFFVQVGAFAVKANAEGYLKTVKKDYPGAFIKVM